MSPRLGGRFVAALLPLALAAACGRGSPRTDLDVRAVLYADPTSLSLLGGTDLNSQIVSHLVAAGLVDYGADMSFRPVLAESWDIAPDGRQVLFHLREGARFQDGSPVTAQDVVFTWSKVRDPSSQARIWYSAFDAVDGVDALDERTVRVRYREPTADLLDAWRVPILPAHAAGLEPKLPDSAFARSPFGAGPFRFVSWTHGRELVLAARAGAAGISGVRLKILSDERTAYRALLRGEVDVLGVTPDVWREALTDPAAAGLARFIYYRLMVWAVQWNEDGSNPFFADPRVRRAMVLALDRERFVSAVVHGLGRPAATTWIPESGWADPGVRPWPFDPAESSRLLDEAGWTRPPGAAVRERDGVPFEFTLLLPAGSQEIADRCAAWLQQSLSDVGVAVRIERIEFKTYLARLRERRFQAAMGTRSFDSPSPDQFDLYHSSQRSGGANYAGLADPACDADLEEGRRTLDPERRRAIYARLQRRIHELEPMSCLFQFAQPILHDRRLEGVRPSPMGLYLFDPGPRAWRWTGRAAAP